MKFLSLIFAAILFSQNALATGSTVCVVDNEDVLIEIYLTNGRIFGSPVVPQSTMNVEFKKPMAVGFSNYAFQIDEFVGWYNLNDTLNFALYAEPLNHEGAPQLDAHVEISLAVETQISHGSADGAVYEGTYVVKQTSNSAGPGLLTQEYSGEISCTAE